MPRPPELRSALRNADSRGRTHSTRNTSFNTHDSAPIDLDASSTLASDGIYPSDHPNRVPRDLRPSVDIGEWARNVEVLPRRARHRDGAIIPSVPIAPLPSATREQPVFIRPSRHGRSSSLPPMSLSIDTGPRGIRGWFHRSSNNSEWAQRYRTSRARLGIGISDGISVHGLQRPRLRRVEKFVSRVTGNGGEMTQTECETVMQDHRRSRHALEASERIVHVPVAVPVPVPVHVPSAARRPSDHRPRSRRTSQDCYSSTRDREEARLLSANTRRNSGILDHRSSLDRRVSRGHYTDLLSHRRSSAQWEGSGQLAHVPDGRASVYRESVVESTELLPRQHKGRRMSFDESVRRREWLENGEDADDNDSLGRRDGETSLTHTIVKMVGRKVLESIEGFFDPRPHRDDYLFEVDDRVDDHPGNGRRRSRHGY